MRKPQAVVVEEDAFIAGMICYFLELQNVSCSHAATIDEAWDLMRGVGPDMAIVDVAARAGDPWSLLRTIRGSHQTADLPVVVVSVAQDAVAVDRAALLRCGWLAKPFSYDELNDRLSDATRLAAGLRAGQH